MKSKIAIIIVAIVSLLLIATYSFAANDILGDAANGIRNFVGGTENVIEDTAKGVTTGIREGFTDVEDATENRTTSNENQSSMMTSNTNNDYTVQRTSATANTNGMLFGNNPLAWSLFILAVLGIITVGLVWYYGSQKEERYTRKNDDNY